jgi:hypothetical protein
LFSSDVLMGREHFILFDSCDRRAVAATISTRNEMPCAAFPARRTNKVTYRQLICGEVIARVFLQKSFISFFRKYSAARLTSQ